MQKRFLRPAVICLSGFTCVGTAAFVRPKTSFACSVPTEPTELIKRIPHPMDNTAKGMKVKAVVITINSGSSYDPLFAEQPQVVQDGVVRVYQCSFKALPYIREQLAGGTSSTRDLSQDAQRVIYGLLQDIAAVDSEAVVFNFECCGGCSDHGFPEGAGASEEVLQFTKAVLDKKCMAMFSDFSLKALIGSWDSAVLGACPFERVGELQSTMELRFDVEQLKSESCPSAQLSTVAKLCVDGKATVSAMGSTIMYSLKNDEAWLDAPYSLEVLSVVSSVDGHELRVPRATRMSKCGSHTGILGHTALRYPSGGVILTSCGHWISLTHLDTAEDNVKQAVRSQTGEKKYKKWLESYENTTKPAQERMLQKAAASCVWSTAPGKYSSS